MGVLVALNCERTALPHLPWSHDLRMQLCMCTAVLCNSIRQPGTWCRYIDLTIHNEAVLHTASTVQQQTLLHPHQRPGLAA